MNNIFCKKEAFIKLPFFISYFITDPIEFGIDLELFKKNIESAIKLSKIDIICFRDKISQDKLPYAKIVLALANKYKIIPIINSDIDLALKLGFCGVHLTSTQFDKISLAKNKNLFVVISCHTEEEVQLAKNLKADMVTYSPIFYKENKGDPKGIDDLSKVVRKYQDNNFFIIALGGIITNTHIKQIQSTNARGFASIRFFHKLK